ncbi:MAG: hypothetical protein WC449_02160 [Candidatus Paceibacterota bacterium]
MGRVVEGGKHPNGWDSNNSATEIFAGFSRDSGPERIKVLLVHNGGSLKVEKSLYLDCIGHCMREFSKKELRMIYALCLAQIQNCKPDNVPLYFTEMMKEFEAGAEKRGIKLNYKAKTTKKSLRGVIVADLSAGTAWIRQIFSSLKNVCKKIVAFFERIWRIIFDFMARIVQTFWSFCKHFSSFTKKIFYRISK